MATKASIDRFLEHRRLTGQASVVTMQTRLEEAKGALRERTRAAAASAGLETLPPVEA